MTATGDESENESGITWKMFEIGNVLTASFSITKVLFLLSSCSWCNYKMERRKYDEFNYVPPKNLHNYPFNEHYHVIRLRYYKICAKLREIK